MPHAYEWHKVESVDVFLCWLEDEEVDEVKATHHDTAMTVHHVKVEI